MGLSYVIYLGLPAFCWVCAYQASRRDNKKMIWVIIIALSLIAGFRDYSVGLDTMSYVSKFNEIYLDRMEYAYGVETSFKYICYVILKIFPSATFLLTLFAFITNWCIITRFWELRKISSFSCMVVCYYVSLFFMTMNCLRQFVAVGIVFYSTRYLSQKKILPYILGVLIASLFHRSAVIGLILVAVNCLRWKELPRKEKIFYVFSVFLIPVIIYAAAQIISRYARYFSEVSLDFGFMLPAKILLFAATFVYTFMMHSHYSYFRNRQSLEKKDQFEILMTCLCYLTALLLGAMGYIFPMVNRSSWYFYPFEGVYFGMLMKGKKPLHMVLIGYAVALLLGYNFLRSMQGNSQGTMPYLFFWQ